MNGEPEIMNATGIAIDGKVVLLRGPSGSGKSDLALQLVGRGHKLISDDYVHLVAGDLGPLAAPPRAISRLIEARGVGVVRLHPDQVSKQAPIALIVDLVPRSEVPRLPDNQVAQVLGLDIPRLRLHAFDTSTPVKIELALRNPLANEDGVVPSDPASLPN
ncbi:MAG: HPr kinase/phosphatase C-terminal domain-containing protein [Alphaproteobacteria bacterium]